MFFYWFSLYLNFLSQKFSPPWRAAIVSRKYYKSMHSTSSERRARKKLASPVHLMIFTFQKMISVKNVSTFFSTRSKKFRYRILNFFLYLRKFRYISKIKNTGLDVYLGQLWILRSVAPMGGSKGPKILSRWSLSYFKTFSERCEHSRPTNEAIRAKFRQIQIQNIFHFS